MYACHFEPPGYMVLSFQNRPPATCLQVQSLLRGVVIPKPGDSKYDVVWHLLRAGRAGGATAAPKYDPVRLTAAPHLHYCVQ